MSYVSANYESFDGRVVGDGQCVAYVRTASGAPQTSDWAEGQKVKGATVAEGTAIATFQGGSYTNSTNGNSHAAIYQSQDGQGLWVYDQWLGHSVQRRLIRFRDGATTPNNDGDAFSVID